MAPARIVKVVLDVERNQRHRSSSIRPGIAPASGVAILVTCLLGAGASGRDRGGTHTGLIVASDVYLRATPFASAETLVEAMSRLRPPQPIGTCCGGAWRVHFAALLERPPGDQTLDLVFYDLPAVGRPGARIRVFSSAIPVSPDETTIIIDDFVISKDLGFVAGHRYEVSLWRRAGAADPSPLATGIFTLR